MFIFKNFNGTEKKCSGCKIWKPVSEFGKEKRSGSGLKNRCKSCTNSDYNKRYQSFKDNKLATCKKRYENKRADILIVCKTYYEKNKEKRSAYNKDYMAKNKETIAAKNKLYREANREKLSGLRKVYVLNNKDKVSKDNAEWAKNKMKTDPVFRLKANMRYLLRGVVRAKGQRTSRLLGYTYLDLISALGRCPELNENIDHKIPMSWFKETASVRLINDLRNLQILSAFENQSKNNKYAHPISFEYFELIKDEIKINHLNKINYGN